jgi:hypothetical protein
LDLLGGLWSGRRWASVNMTGLQRATRWMGHYIVPGARRFCRRSRTGRLLSHHYGRIRAPQDLLEHVRF